jgi:1-acyl-sn-glycerol-3-phosphate acyltransferase
MRLAYHVVTGAIKWATRRLVRVYDAQLARVPERGPLILVTNHVNFVEIPVLFTHLLPRKVTGIAKAENWQNPTTRWLMKLWDGLPVRRGEADLSAIRRGLAVLAAGGILAIAPEGTRSGDGKLQRGHAGVVLLALRAQVLLMPLVFYGAEHFWCNLAAFHRSDFHIVAGEPFQLDAGQTRVTRAVRAEIADEIMYQLAALLPPAYRGIYANLERATEKYLRFLPGATSNLARAQS